MNAVDMQLLDVADTIHARWSGCCVGKFYARVVIDREDFREKRNPTVVH